MDRHAVILRIDDCLRTSNDGPRRRELLEICRQNLHLTGDQLFDAFRGHLDLVRLRSLVSTWDTWRGMLSMSSTSLGEGRTWSRSKRAFSAEGRTPRAISVSGS